MGVGVTFAATPRTQAPNESAFANGIIIAGKSLICPREMAKLISGQLLHCCDEYKRGVLD